MSLPIENNQKDRIPFEHYMEEYKNLTPSEVVMRTGVAFDEEKGAFQLTLLGIPCEVAFPSGEISCPDLPWFALSDPNNLSARTFVLRYLIRGSKVTPSGRFITYNEMPWGEVYLRQFTGRCISRLAFGFGFKPAAFVKGCEKLNGRQIKQADYCYEIDIMGTMSIRFLLWEGDEEFPPSAQILFSDSFICGSEAEDLCVACDITIGAIKALSK